MQDPFGKQAMPDHPEEAAAPAPMPQAPVDQMPDIRCQRRAVRNQLKLFDLAH